MTTLRGTEFEELPQELVITIAGNLTTHDVARMKAVSRAWQDIGSLLEVQQAAFKNTWGLHELQNEPKTSNFYLAAGLAHFVIKVTLGSKTSLASILVKFRTDGVTLRILNNCASDFALQCRPYIYIPVTNKELLHGKTGAFHYDATCRRQFIVLAQATSSQGDENSTLKTMEALARSDAAYRPPDTVCGIENQKLTDYQKEALMKKLSKQMSKGLRIDDGTAAYYLRLTNGDMKSAIMMYKDDEQWEEGNAIGMLPVRQRHPIPEYEFARS